MGLYSCSKVKGSVHCNGAFLAPAWILLPVLVQQQLWYDWGFKSNEKVGTDVAPVTHVALLLTTFQIRIVLQLPTLFEAFTATGENESRPQVFLYSLVVHEIRIYALA